MAKYKGPPRPIPLARDPFPDSWLLLCFALLAMAFVLTVLMWG